VSRTSPAPYLALGVHLGLLLICVSAVYTRQYGFSMLRWSGIGALGLVLLGSGLATRGLVALTKWGRLLLALAAGLLLALAYEPQLAEIPLLGRMGDLPYLPVSLGSVGVALVLIFWLLCHLAQAEMGMLSPPFRQAVLVTGAALVGLAALLYFLFAPLYDMEGGEPTRLVVFNVFQYTVLLAGVVSTSGGPGIRGWPLLYLGLALLGAVAHNLLVGNGGLP
jgi:hypothetical protein